MRGELYTTVYTVLHSGCALAFFFFFYTRVQLKNGSAVNKDKETDSYISFMT